MTITIQVSEKVLNAIQSLINTFETTNTCKYSPPDVTRPHAPAASTSCAACSDKSPDRTNQNTALFNPNQVVERLREAVTAYKEARGWTLTKVAAHCDLTLSQLSNCIYQGRGASLRTIARIINALDLDPLYVFFGVGTGPFKKLPENITRSNERKPAPSKKHEIVKYVVDHKGQVTAKELIERFDIPPSLATNLLTLGRTLLRAAHALVADEEPPPRSKTEAALRFLLKNRGTVPRKELANRFNLNPRYAGQLQEIVRHLRKT